MSFQTSVILSIYEWFASCASAKVTAKPLAIVTDPHEIL